MRFVCEDDPHVLLLTKIYCMYYELSKREKKIARACIDKGLDAEFQVGLENIEAIISDWRNGEFAGNKDAYHEMYRGLDTKNRAIA